MVCASVGDADQVMTWLEEGVLLRRGFDPLCFDSRFQNLQHRVGLPYSKSALQIPSGSTYAWAGKEPFAAFTLWAATACFDCQGPK